MDRQDGWTKAASEVRVLAEASEATPEWLTQALRQAGVLQSERVVGVARRENAAFNSSVTHLALTYDGEPAGAPPSLVLKLNRDGWGEADAGLYQLAMQDAGALPMLVRCYEAAYDPVSGLSHCLLEDV